MAVVLRAAMKSNGISRSLASTTKPQPNKHAADSSVDLGLAAARIRAIRNDLRGCRLSIKLQSLYHGT